MGAVIVAGRYVPRPPEDDIWNWGPSRSIPEFLMPVGGGFPFVNKRWSANYDDAAVWYRNGSSFSALRLPPVTVLPFSNQRWPANYDDAAVWQNESVPVPPVQKLVGGNFPFLPRRWTRDYDDASFWQNVSVPVAPVSKLVNGNLPFIAKRWTGDYDDAASWQNKPVPIPPVNRLVGGNFPFKPTFWTSYDEPAVFYGRSLDVPIQLLPTGAAPFVPARWKFDVDQPTEWVGHSGSAFWVLDQSFQLYAPSTTRIIAPGNEPETWAGNRAQVNNSLLSAQAAVVLPFAAVRWRFNNDDASLWVVESFPVPRVQSLVGGNYPFKPPYWKNNNDDSPVWSGGPTNVNRVIDLAASAPFVPVRWRLDYDDASFWTRQPRSSQTLLNAPLPTFFGALGQSPTHRWNFDYVPPSDWVGAPFNGYSVNQPTPPPPVTDIHFLPFIASVGPMMTR